jgi:hypothetical protein
VSNALFGPDGTQLPEPETVLPDALVSPGRQDAFVLPPLPELPPLPDADEVHRSFTDEFLATPPKGFPLPPAVPPPVPPPVPSPHPDQARRPAAGPRRAARNAAPARTSAPHPPHRPPPPPGYQPGPGQFSPPYGGPPGYPPGPQPQNLPYAGRPRDERHNPLIQRSRRGSGGWVGCVVVLVFAVAVGFNAVQAIVTAVIDLLR